MSQHRYLESKIRDGYTVIDCKDCGYWHVYPIPTEEELNNYYQKKYYENLGDNRSMTDKVHDPDGYYAIQYGDKLRWIWKYLPPKLPLRILDIGCGYGDFLSFMKSKGWEIMGIEPSESAYKICKDSSIDVRCIPFSRIPELGLPKYSVVTLNSTLEHLAEPAKILTMIKDSILIEGGILNIRVPNDFSFLQCLLNETVLRDDRKNYWLHPPEHLNYWTHSTLKWFLFSLGYKVVYLTSTFPLELFPLMGEDYITNPELGRPMHLKRVKIEKRLHESGNDDFKDKLFDAFAKLGLGREIELLATIRG